jgi:hypothetical protein
MPILVSDLGAIVSAVRVVCHTLGLHGNSRTASANHWSIYFLIDNDRSVQFNMTAEEGIRTGRLDTDSRDYVFSNTAIHARDYPAIAKFRVDEVYGYLVNQLRYDLYDMAEDGTGCRHWVFVHTS